jgi:hypothetical protein
VICGHSRRRHPPADGEAATGDPRAGSTTWPRPLAKPAARFRRGTRRRLHRQGPSTAAYTVASAVHLDQLYRHVRSAPVDFMMESIGCAHATPLFRVKHERRRQLASRQRRAGSRSRTERCSCGAPGPMANNSSRFQVPAGNGVSPNSKLSNSSSWSSALRPSSSVPKMLSTEGPRPRPDASAMTVPSGGR